MSQVPCKTRRGGIRFHIGDWGDLLSTAPVGRRVFTERAAGAGFDGIDFIMPSHQQCQDFFKRDEDYLCPDDFNTDDKVKREVDWCSSLAEGFLYGDGVPFVWAHNPFDGQSNESNSWVKCCVDALTLMGKLRKFGGLAAGAGLRIDTSVKTHDMTVPEADWVTTFAPRAKHVGKVARDLGFPVFMEPEPCWPGIQNRVAVLDMLAALVDSGVDVMYDFAHAYLQGQTPDCQPAGLVPYPDHVGFINDLRSRIGKLHVADTTGKLHGQSGHAPTGEHAIPGDGILSTNNFAPMRAIIRELALKVPGFAKMQIWTADVCMVDAEKLKTCFPAVLACMAMLHKEVEHVYSADGF